MDKSKVIQTTLDLKKFFQKKELTVLEVKESLYRMIEYIDVTFEEDYEDDVVFGLNKLVQQVR